MAAALRGYIIRVTKLYNDSSSEYADTDKEDDVRLQPWDEPVYALVEEKNGSFWKLFWLDSRADVDGWPAGVEYGFDQFVRVPDKDVPDEVWAVLARKKLMQ